MRTKTQFRIALCLLALFAFAAAPLAQSPNTATMIYEGNYRQELFNGRLDHKLTPIQTQLVAAGTATNAIPSLANIDPPRMFQFQVRFVF